MIYYLAGCPRAPLVRLPHGDALDVHREDAGGVVDRHLGTVIPSVSAVFRLPFRGFTVSALRWFLSLSVLPF